MPRGSPAGSVNRVTTTFDPKPNPTLDDGHFRFTVPDGQR
jgi:outer membrane lipoprotein-sorting protein